MAVFETETLLKQFAVSVDWSLALDDRHDLVRQLHDFYEAAREIDHIAAALALHTDKKDIQFQFLINPAYVPEWLSAELEETVYFDIETYVQEGHTHFGLGVTINAKGSVRYWNEADLSEMVAYLLTYKQIISYNGQKFDIPVLCHAINDPQKAQALFNRSFDAIWFVDLMETRQHLFALKSIAQTVLNLDASYFSAHASKDVPALIVQKTEEAIRAAMLHCFKDVGLLIRVVQYYSLSTDKKIKIFDHSIIENIHMIIKLTDDWLGSVFESTEDNHEKLVATVFEENEPMILEIEELMAMLDRLPQELLTQREVVTMRIGQHVGFVRAYRENPTTFARMTLNGLMYWHFTSPYSEGE